MNKLNLITLTLLSSVVGSSVANPPGDDPFAELDSAMEQLEYEGSEAEMSEFQQWKDSYLAEYQAFRQEHFQRLDDIRDKLIADWGESETSTESKYVEYDEKQQTKTVVDFEKNEIRISVIHDEKQKVSEEQLTEAIKKVQQSTHQVANDEDVDVVTTLVGQKADEKVVETLIKKATKKEESLAEKAEQQQAIIAKEIEVIEKQTVAQEQQVEQIHDLVSAGSENPAEAVSTEAAEQAIAAEKKQIAEEKKARIAALEKKTQALAKTPSERDKLKDKKITTYTIPLGKQKELNKAKPFINDVLEQSARWQLQPSLMLAIMHTESYFNPKAQSHIPAFGLMQIVPRTAGVDVNRFLFDKDEPMAENTLFQPDANIEAGVAYMHILNSRYLRKIEDPISRTYCVIAAYNTGSGNVAKTFNKDGSRNINKASKIINQLTPEQVYDRLIAHLPYDETRNYLKKVTNRRGIYTQIDKI